MCGVVSHYYDLWWYYFECGGHACGKGGYACCYSYENGQIYGLVMLKIGIYGWNSNMPETLSYF